MESWRSIRDYPNYEVSDYGNVRNRKTGRILKQNRHRQGYSLVKLSNEDGVRGKSVHRMVAEAFVPNYENKPQVNHIDGNKSNNYADNLEWNTGSENTRHAYETGLFDGRPKTKVRIIETGETFSSIHECADVIHGSIGDICECIHRKIETYRGLHFEVIP